MMRGMMRPWLLTLSAGIAVTAMSGTVSAMTLAKLQPNETDSDDVFTYQFAGAGFGIAPSAAAQNLDTDSLLAIPTNPVIGLLLGTSRTATTTHAIDANGNLLGSPGFDPASATNVDTGHDGFSWIKFDLSGVVVPPNQPIKAKLHLWALDGFGITAAFANPSAAEPVETEVYAAGGPWDEQSLTWDTQGPVLPGFGSPVDTVTQTGVNRWVMFDVTSLVESWLADPSSNNGFFLRQKEIVPTANLTSGLTGVVSSLYASSWFGDPSAPAFNTSSDQRFRPILQIAEVPEPATAVMSLMAVGSLVLGARRRSA